ncbi:MAG: RHS repeat-associated core domain-containing protein, partial [Patescibacteria group bacterium]
TKYGYSGNNTLDTITDARNFQTVFIHDTKGNQIKSTNAKGFSDSTGYTSLNKPNYIRDKESNVYRTNYSATGNPTQIILPTNDTLKREYDSRGLDTAVTDARGFKTKKVYNNYGDLIQTITPTSVTTIAYDAVGRPVEITDSYGRKDSLFWNNFDQLIRKKDKLGRIEEFGFDANGNQVSYKDKKGFVTNTVYNKHDKPLRIAEPQNHITEIEYDDNQRKKRIRNPNKNTLIYNYDDAGRELSVADSVLGVLSQRTYDPSGNVTTYSDALNKIWTNRVDEINRTTSTVNPLGDSIQYKYNKNNLPIEQIDEEGKSTKWEYDVASRHIKTTDARNNYVQRFLNKNGLQDSIRDSRGNTRNKATYDGSDRMLTLNDGFGNYIMTWDSSGNVKTITDPSNRVLSHFYNNNNELTDIKNGANILRHYQLDDEGDYLEANSSTQTASVIRNQLGWITQYSNTFSNTLHHVYDSVGNVTRITYPGGKQVNYKYNSLNQCTEVKDWTNAIYTIARNNNGSITSIQYPNVYKTEITRDDASRVSEWFNKSNTNSIFQSNLIKRSKSGDILRDSGMHVLTFTPFIQAASGTYGKDDRLQTYGNAICTTNNTGQRLFLNAPGKSYSYTWSFMSELEATSHTVPAQSMQYDAFNERVTKRTSPTDTVRYIIDHNLAPFPIALQERTAADQEIINYVYIPGEGILLARDSAGTFRYYHHDVKGNTIALTDVGGVITDRYEYNEFGDSIYHNGSNPQPFTWMGMYGVQHDGNGLYYMHARYYDGKTNSFISKDPHPVNYLNTQDVDRYVYGYNNPLKYIDPTGLYANNIIDNESIFSYIDAYFNVRANLFHNNLYWVGKTTNKIYTKVNGVFGSKNYLKLPGGYAASNKIVGNSLQLFKGISKRIGYVGVGFSVASIANEGLNYNTGLDLLVSGSTFHPIGWYVSGVYFLMDMAAKSISGKDFGQNLDELIRK